MRKLRITNAAARTQHVNSIDDIKDPSLLAHALMNLDGLQESMEYTSFLRISSLHDVCVRERLLGYRQAATFRRKTDIAMRVTFDLGTGMHQFFQNTPTYFGSRRQGWWRCLACGHAFWGRGRPTSPCVKCKARHDAISYHEHSIKMTDPYRASGHIDLFLEAAPGDIRIADLKSLNGPEFDALTSPKGDHVVQVTGYMVLAEKDMSLPVRVNTERALLIYMSKKHTTKGLPFKAFSVQRNAATEAYVVDTLSSFTQGIADPGYLCPPLPSCARHEFTSYRAKTCPMRTQCMESK